MSASDDMLGDLLAVADDDEGQVQVLSARHGRDTV